MFCGRFLCRDDSGDNLVDWNGGDLIKKLLHKRHHQKRKARTMITKDQEEKNCQQQVALFKEDMIEMVNSKKPESSFALAGEIFRLVNESGLYAEIGDKAGCCPYIAQAASEFLLENIKQYGIKGQRG